MPLEIRTKSLAARIGRLAEPNLSRATVGAAKVAWAHYRSTEHGFATLSPALLSPPSANVKLTKSAAWGLALAPHNMSGWNVCPSSTPNCRKGCVADAGKGSLDSVKRARIAKTGFLAEHPEAFATLLADELSRLPEGAYVRLNTFSDLPWERIAPWVFTMRPDITFYDYTKVWSRVLEGALPTNYHVALSASERTTDLDICLAAEAGHNVAVVYNAKRGHDLPDRSLGADVIDADKSDRWMVDHQGVIGGLRAKGDMIRNPGRMVRTV